MWSLNLNLAKIFSPKKPSKSVSFAPFTASSLGRSSSHFLRSHPEYIPGTHSCPPSLGRWLDTSLMYDDYEQLLHLKIHATFRVRDRSEAAALQMAFQTQMNAGKPLVAAAKKPVLLEDHPLCDRVLRIFLAMLEDRFRGGVAAEIDEEWREAKAIILYTTYEGAFVSLQFVNDVDEERDADRFVEELRRSVPAGNVGVPPRVRLQMMREGEVAAEGSKSWWASK
ncbi:hypothetical protein GMOD_00006892 [Pyrenophora seminiperda CCB06]|uniref:Uncharacterized protein n=1 Tax=Pyrenophora seminiperda CCB06 TaxID=1302712 RepID=A0A3M7MB89_9PLEO|nr:hypothetical protein GMOD_00006892 [Pyrenophora seminiperda CCB06]